MVRALVQVLLDNNIDHSIRIEVAEVLRQSGIEIAKLDLEKHMNHAKRVDEKEER